MDSQPTTVQIGKEYIPLLKQLAKNDKRSMRQYLEVMIVKNAASQGLITKKGE